MGGRFRISPTLPRRPFGFRGGLTPLRKDRSAFPAYRPERSDEATTAGRGDSPSKAPKSVNAVQADAGM